MDKDDYDEIINGENTYNKIVEKLMSGNSVIIGWTDEEYTHLDILFSIGTYKEVNNLLQRGLRGKELFVSIIGIGAFGFDIHGEKSSGYISEKLQLYGSPTIEKLTELINNICQKIINYYK